MQRSAMVPLADFMRGRLPEGEGTKVLEVGCGTGRFGTFLKVRPDSVILARPQTGFQSQSHHRHHVHQNHQQFHQQHPHPHPNLILVFMKAIFMNAIEELRYSLQWACVARPCKFKNGRF